MKKGIAFLMSFLFLLVFSACGQRLTDLSQGRTEARTSSPSVAGPAQGEMEGAVSSSAGQTGSVVSLFINGRELTVEMENTPAAEAFLERLPLTIEMKELNGNEKYYYFEEDLPEEAMQPGRVETGDLMLYGPNCLVLFYESFATQYSYTPLGKVRDPAALKEALGTQSATITFSLDRSGGLS